MSQLGRALSITRNVAADDMTIKRDGSGRTVIAYMAPFDAESEVNDEYGEYRETIVRTAFNKTLKDNGQSFPVFYNHGMTIHGTPSDKHSTPLGRSAVAKPDGRGLYTETTYDNTPQADEVLEGVKSGAIGGMSFSGRVFRSEPLLRRGGILRADRNGQRPLVTHHELGITEFGPTPFPVHEGAAIIATRAQFSITPADKALLTMLLANLADGDEAIDPIVAQASAIMSLDCAFDTVQFYLAQLLGVPDPDDDDTSLVLAVSDDSMDRSQAMHRLNALATRLGPMRATSTPSGAAVPARLKATTRLGLRAIIQGAHAS